MGLKVKPMDLEEFSKKENGTFCSNIIMKFVILTSNALGLWPIDQNKQEFRLFSKRSLVSLIKIAVLTIPVQVVPITIYFTGWIQEEFQKTVGTDESMWLEETFVETLTFSIEFFLNFLIYILPFAFASVAVRPMKKCQDIMDSPQNRGLENNKSSGIAFPILGFVLFTLGKLLKTIDLLGTLSPTKMGDSFFRCASIS